MCSKKVPVHLQFQVFILFHFVLLFDGQVDMRRGVCYVYV
jgi:hypothetical protein